MSNNDSEILGDWAGLGYFTQEDSDHSVAVCYKDGGRDVVLAIFNQNVVTQDALQAVCERHQGKLALERILPEQ